MKSLMTLVLVLFAGSAHAFESISCIGNEEFGTTKKITLTLEAVDQTVNDVDEGVKVPYKFVLKNGSKIWAQGTVKAEQEDVLFGYKGKGSYGEVTGMIYMDEADHSWLNFNKRKLNLDCRQGE